MWDFALMPASLSPAHAMFHPDRVRFSQSMKPIHQSRAKSSCVPLYFFDLAAQFFAKNMLNFFVKRSLIMSNELGSSDARDY